MKDIVRKIFVVAGKFVFRFYFRIILERQPQAEKVIFFFPGYHIGGAERVHADLLECFKDIKPLVIFTDHSQNKGFKKIFKNFSKILDTKGIGYFPLARYVLPRILAETINSIPSKVIIGSNSPFFYSLLPYLTGKTKIIDIIHAFGGGIENISLPYVNLIDARVVITPQTRTLLMDQYKQNGISLELAGRILIIENKVKSSGLGSNKNFDNFQILFVGRNSPEKRVHILKKIYEECQTKRFKFTFNLVGDDFRGSFENNDTCRIFGELFDQEKLAEIYSNSHILILTSESEGFPMVVMEAMIKGVVPICTNVGGLSTHIKNGVNGFLIDSQNESGIIKEISSLILKLDEDRNLMEEISRNAYNYACKNFTGNDFCQKYHRLILKK